jgi:bifunctional non-homologous end joining protein LigD
MRSVRDPLAVLSTETRGRLIRRPQAGWYDPMLATLTEHRFSDPAWIFERKLDGERCMAFKKGGRVRLLSRNRLDLTAHYPEVANALRGQVCRDAVLDGEIVALRSRQTSFERLQRRMHVAQPSPALVRDVPVVFFMFDVVHAAGHDLLHVELLARKAVLERLLDFGGPLRLTTHRSGAGESAYRDACAKGWEGVIAKRAGSPYTPGRSRDWLKFKCVNEQEFVIGGWTDPKGSRAGLGALLIGYYAGDELRYAGKVGTGFDARTLADLGNRLARIARNRTPFSGARLPRLGVHWVDPVLVCQVGFSEWTRDGELRHPRYLGLRDDKDPREVVRERPG